MTASFSLRETKPLQTDLFRAVGQDAALVIVEFVLVLPVVAFDDRDLLVSQTWEPAEDLIVRASVLKVRDQVMNRDPAGGELKPSATIDKSNLFHNKSPSTNAVSALVHSKRSRQNRQSDSDTGISRRRGMRGAKWGQMGPPTSLGGTGRTIPPLVRLTIMTLAGSTSDRAKATRAEGEHLSMARRNRAEVVVAAEIGVYQGPESILDRLKVSAESWLETVAQFGRRFHRAVGLADHLKAEAQRLGVKWLRGVRSSQVAFAHSPCP